MISSLFIDRPRFAMVIAVVMMLAGMLALTRIPVAQFPPITPPEALMSRTATSRAADMPGPKAAAAPVSGSRPPKRNLSWAAAGVAAIRAAADAATAAVRRAMGSSFPRGGSAGAAPGDGRAATLEETITKGVSGDPAIPVKRRESAERCRGGNAARRADRPA